VYYNGTSIVCEDEDARTITTLYTGAGITNVIYMGNYIYFTQGTGVFKMLTDLVSVGTPGVAIYTAGYTISYMSITSDSAQNLSQLTPSFWLYVTNGTNSSNFIDCNGSLLSTFAYSYRSVFVVQNQIMAIDGSTGFLYYFPTSPVPGNLFLPANGTVIPNTLTPNPIYNGASDGTYLYLNPTVDNLIYKLTFSTSSTTPTLAMVVTLVNNSNLTSPWNVYNGMLCYQTLGFQAYAISLNEDTQISYPNNLMPELISYQCGLDFLTKQKADTAGLEKRYASLFKRYLDSLKRDDYSVEKVKNTRRRTSTGWGQ
jgi:hypothetical protein